ncbi:MAG: UDP-glucose/GDP-mannose dehydrogenase family protein [Bacillota bacterium]
MRVAIIGAGYVGLTTGVALAYLGHDVVAVDQDPAKVELLRRRKSPIHEAGLGALLEVVDPRFTAASDVGSAVSSVDVVIIAVGTPPKPNGNADTRHVEQAAREVAEHLGLRPEPQTVVIKSTVPIGTHRRVKAVVERTLSGIGRPATVYVASNPEFLREGRALRDMFYPDRIVVGAEDEAAFSYLRALYQPILDQSFIPPEFLDRPPGMKRPVFVATDPSSAEMIKYAANAFVALKISFINEMAGLCERVGADVGEVARGIGLDPRIGPDFLGAGLGWGGSCLPKDTAALLGVASEYGYRMPLVEAAREINERQKLLAIEKLQAGLKVLRGRTIGVLGLAFKPGTDDVRESVSLAVIRLLVERGAHVRAHDPIAAANARTALADLDEVELVADPLEAADGADALLIATDWEEYRCLPLPALAARMRTRVLVDGRNLLRPDEAVQAGFTYFGFGRSVG